MPAKGARNERSRDALVGDRAGSRAAAGARHVRRLPALGEPLGLAARDRRRRASSCCRPTSTGSLSRCRWRSRRSSPRRSSATSCSGSAGLIGADARVPTMVLLRAPLGRRGSYLPTGLNILQCLGWSVFELIIIATGASALSKQVLGFGGVSFWKITFGIVATVLALARPGRVRAQVRAEVRGLGGDRLAAVHLVVVAARPTSRGAVAPRRLARILARFRSRPRLGDQLDPARRRLHTLLTHPRGRLLECRSSATSCRRSRCSRSAP